jgi:hypothetical protein
VDGDDRPDPRVDGLRGTYLIPTAPDMADYNRDLGDDGVPVALERNS